MKSDIEIAQSATLLPMEEIARKAGILPQEMLPYGRGMAKVEYTEIERRLATKKPGRLILVTAITPTPAGEGKTTTSIGLGDGLSLLGKNVMIALREPSLGPVFGVKGGAAGGGMSQVLPMEELNLHFTGDIHAITAANNLLAAMLDNHIYQGNALGIDPQRITWKRCMDMNDRQLRHITSGQGRRTDGVEHEDGFDITAASEVMAVLCLASDLDDLKRRLGNIIVAYNQKGEPVRARDLNAQGAMAALLKEAMKPNLVQTIGHTPVLIHGGPFANIAHGCNSVVATQTARLLGDYTVTEAGFGADLGAEKFLDIKCRKAGIWPDAVVLVATIRALKFHGGLEMAELGEENLDALGRGLENLGKHLENLRERFQLPCVVAVNRFAADTQAEIQKVMEYCEKKGAQAVLSECWEKGGEGALDLARAVVELCETGDGVPHYTYPDDLPLMEKIQAVATRIYGADDVEFSDAARSQLAELTRLGMGDWPVCIAKTQMSLSDDAKLRGRPQGFTVKVRSAKASAGAEFIVVLAGAIMTMPGLPKVPAAEGIDIDRNGSISGLF
ncbi:formate--tetrahydrofolate ligase [Christensenella sp. MSJ-20]|uniref:formate--tetrahydrofolate ligase n=1 Tax=Christensenella sp. MSJ-20 TaxID=2841518 RepID=UPI0037BFB9F9